MLPHLDIQFYQVKETIHHLLFYIISINITVSVTFSIFLDWSLLQIFSHNCLLIKSNIQLEYIKGISGSCWYVYTSLPFESNWIHYDCLLWLKKTKLCCISYKHQKNIKSVIENVDKISSNSTIQAVLLYGRHPYQLYSKRDSNFIFFVNLTEVISPIETTDQEWSTNWC